MTTANARLGSTGEPTIIDGCIDYTCATQANVGSGHMTTTDRVWDLKEVADLTLAELSGLECRRGIAALQDQFGMLGMTAIREGVDRAEAVSCYGAKGAAKKIHVDGRVFLQTKRSGIIEL